MTNEEYIQQNRTEDVRRLALSRIPEGVDAVWCMQQIEGWQIARKKLPSWASKEGIWFPPKLSMEQCSSEVAAEYKAKIIERILPEKRIRMVDFTAGYGIDFSFIAPLFDHAVYVERLPHLCDIARHNMPLLGIKNADIHNSDSYIPDAHLQLAFLDPARRDDIGRKTVAIEDCTPDVVQLQDKLLDTADIVMIKLSPMLDITQTLRSLKCVLEIHIVGVRGECKELLVILGKKENQSRIFCANLESSDPDYSCTVNNIHDSHADIIDGYPHHGMYLYEPNACILKAGMQDVVAIQLGLQKLHPQSNLFLSPECREDFPGRIFKITGISDFSKKGQKELLSGIKKANLTIRNFPTSVADLRKKLKLQEGGDTYLFATTIYDSKHILIKCESTGSKSRQSKSSYSTA